MMPNKPENPPAFPYQHNPAHGGMSLLDWFAGQALAGLAANPNVDLPAYELSYDAFYIADAMLRARES